MGKTKLTCRVCGKEYEPCRTAIKNPNVFHWQEVACSPECGAKYLQRVKDSRKSAEPIKKSKVKRLLNIIFRFHPTTAMLKSNRIQATWKMKLIIMRCK